MTPIWILAGWILITQPSPQHGVGSTGSFLPTQPLPIESIHPTNHSWKFSTWRLCKDRGKIWANHIVEANPELYIVTPICLHQHPPIKEK